MRRALARLLILVLSLQWFGSAAASTEKGTLPFREQNKRVASPLSRFPVSTLFDTTFQASQSQSLGQGLAITGTVAAATVGGGALYDMGAAAQTTVLTDGIAGVSAAQWVRTAGIGSALTLSTNLLVDPKASPASLSFSTVSGALGGVTKLGLNAAAGLANQLREQ